MTKVCNASLKVCDQTCLSVDRKWWYYIATSSALWLGGILIILTVRIVKKLCRSRKVKGRPNPPDKRNGREEEANTQTQWVLWLREGAANLVTAQSFKGRCFVVISFILSLFYIVLYAIESAYPIEHCLDIKEGKLWMFEIGFNAFFIMHFVLRFLASNDKLWFWCDPLSLVDFFTIPQVFVSLIIRQNWLGLRFLRAMQFIRLADILQFVGILKSSNSIVLMVMVGKLCAIWFTFAGLIHLLENSGDPWDFYGDHVDLNFFSCLYFLVVTMSTVGFGDIYAVTYLGRIVMMFFIVIGLGMFASYIPAIMEYLGSHTPYHGSFKVQEGRKHVVLCGHITKDSVENFLRDFLHKDRENIAVSVVIIANFIPSPDLQAVLKQHFVNVAFFKGSVLNGDDCDRIKMKRADACIILCDKECPDPDAEDEENIMRVVAVKDNSPGIRIVIQLMQYHNKSYLLNIPSWNSKAGDDVVCVSELKLGFLAQSCLSPGFSTLLANIFSMRSNDLSNAADEHDWQTSYIRGVSNEMYTEFLSKAFKGMNFQQASEICFEKLDLLMVAMEITNPDGERVFAINPGDNMKVGHQTRGYFITGSSSQVKRALYYCSSCHRDVTDLELIKECKCEKGMPFEQSTDKTPPGNAKRLPGVLDVRQREQMFKFSRMAKASLAASADSVVMPTKRAGSYKVLNRLKNLKAQCNVDQYRSNDRPIFDMTCTFYWCPPRSFEEAMMTREDARNNTFSGHILVCIFDSRDAPLHGLRTLVMPLRASNLMKSELKKIVFLGDRGFLEKEWAQLENFDDVFVLPGSPFCRADLRALNANLADMVVFLSPNKGNRVDDPELADKESILASLNLKAMSFDDAVGLLKQTSRDAFMPLDFADVSPRVERRGSAFGCNIPMITELLYDKNVKYLDLDDVDEEDMDLYKTQQFACGSAFTVSMLDSLISATYFSKDILTLVRTLVTGGINPVLEEQIAEGEEIRGAPETEETAENRSRCKISQISLYDGPLAQFGDKGLYGHMFLYALKKHSMICLAVYRFRDTKFVRGVPCAKRYVICAPPYKFKLQSTDLVFVLAHSDVSRGFQTKL